MPRVDVYDLEKNKTGEVDLSPDVFECTVKEPLLHLVTGGSLAPGVQVPLPQRPKEK